MRVAGTVCLLGVLCLIGCGAQNRAVFKAATEATPPQAGLDVAARKDAAQPPQTRRKIIYTAKVEVVVEDLDEADRSLAELLTAHEGYVARSERSGMPGTARRGSWTLRVPVARFDQVLKDLADLGEVRRSTLDSDDITDRYFDTQAEMTNLEAREKALRKLYEEKIASKLSDLLDVDRELSKVRGEINLRKGQLQRWDKETAFATIHLDLFDRRGYVPPTAPAFGTTIGRTFEGSLQALVDTGKALVLAAVAVAPWLAVLAVLGLPLALLRRRRVTPPPLPAASADAGPEAGRPLS